MKKNFCVKCICKGTGTPLIGLIKKNWFTKVSFFSSVQ
jgi:hypothetical protein